MPAKNISIVPQFGRLFLRSIDAADIAMPNMAENAKSIK